MDPLLKENLITTKDASELSGYTSDYLARLVRSGEITGKKIGHSWLVDSSSLDAFLGKQKDHKLNRSRELADSRAQEYRTHNLPVRRIPNDFTKKFSVADKIKSFAPEIDLTSVSLRSHVFALALSLAVVISGATLAHGEMLSGLGARVADIATVVAQSMKETYGDVPANFIAHVTDASLAVREIGKRVAIANATVTANLALPSFANPDLTSVQMVLGENDRTHVAQIPALGGEASKLNAVHGSTREEVQSFADEAFQFITSPAQVATTFAHTYVAIGYDGYALINSSLASYRSLIEHIGANVLTLATTTRDTLATAPRFVSNMNLALGNAVIDVTHAAIQAEVNLAYSPGVVAPAAARTTVALLNTVGDVLMRGTIATPTIAKMAYLRTTEAPSHIAPALARGIFDAEYAGASRFIAVTNAATDRYLALVETTGRVAYTSAIGTRARISNSIETLKHAPVALENIYLGALGNTAVALDTLAHTSPVAAVIVATTPAYSAGEKIALATYREIHGVFESMTDALAVLFTPPPITPLPPSLVPEKKFATLTPPTRVTSYPTYTTVVSGISQDTLTKALEAERNRILATVAGMMQPVIVQGSTNMTTIQQVNMIQDLTNLIVHNGDFRGGIFDKGILSNGISVSAAIGHFDSLTAGNTSITGNLAVTGAISSNTNITAPYFVATSTMATSTFAGSLNIDNGGFVYATSTRNIGIGVLSPAALLAIQNSTSTQPIFIASNAAGAEVYRITDNGFVGIGTTTPGYALAVEGSSSLGNQAIAGYFTATTSTATSTFAGSLAVGTTSPWGNGLFTVGTTSPLLHIDNNSGNVGINALATNYRLDINGTIRSVGDAFFNTNTTLGSSTTTDVTYFNSRIAGHLVPTVDNVSDIGDGTNWLRWRTGYFGTSVGIAGTATSTGASLLASGAYLIDSASPLSLNTAHNQNVLFGTGNIGLGIAVPTYTLDVAGNAHFTSYVDASHFVATSTTAISTFMGGFTAGNNAALVINQAAPANSLQVISSGDVGVNTSVPLYKLDVNGTFRTVGATFLNANTTIGGTLAQTGLATFTSGFLANASSTITSGLFTMSGGASTTNITASGNGYFGNSIDINGTATSTGISLLASGAYLIDSASPLSLNTTHDQNVLFGTGNVLLPFASSTALTLANAIWIGGNATTTSNGNFSTNGTLSVAGTSLLSGLATFTNGFLANASSTITSGLFTMSGGASTTNITASGNGYITGALSANSLTLANALTVGNGGTGVTTITGLVKGNGSSAFTAAVPSEDYVGPATTVNGHQLSSNVTVLLSDLGDATVTAPVTDQILKWNGSKWTNGAFVTTNAGSGVDFFYTVMSSDVSPYDSIEKSPDPAAEVNEYTVVNNSTSRIDTYLSPSGGIGSVQIDSGVWTFNTYATSSSAVGMNTLNYNVYKRTAGGTETFLFAATTTSITSATPTLIQTQVVQPAFVIDPTDRLLVRVTGTTDNVSDTTLNFIHSGNLHYSFINTPLIIRHNDLAGLQGGATGQDYHLSLAEYTGTGTGTFVRQIAPTVTESFNIAGAAGGIANIFSVSTSTMGFATTTALTVDQYGDLSLLSGANLSVGGTITANAGIVSAGPISFTGTGHAGLKINNLTTLQRDALTPASGMTIFNTSVSKMQVYNGSSWKNVGNPEIGAEVTSGTAGSVLFVDASGNLAQDNANFYWDATNRRLGLGTTTPSAMLAVQGNSYVSGSSFFGGAITATSTLSVDGIISANAGIVSAGTISFTGTNHAGLTINNLTDAQRGALTPASGMTIFNTTVSKMQVYNGSEWKNVGNPEIGAEVTAGTAGSVLFVDASGNLAQNNSYFYWDDTNRRLGLGTTTPSSALDIASEKTGINIWAATSTNYKKANIGYSDAIVNDVFTISTNAPVGGTYQDIQIVPNGGGGNTGLYMNTSGQSGLGYTSFGDTSIGTALLINGRVGIGTTTPTSAFSVVANGRATGDLRYGIQIVNSDTANTQATNIGFFGQGGSSGNKWVVGTDVYHNNSNNFFIATSSGPGTVAPLVITSEGALQLGNTTGVAVGNKLYAQGGALYWDSTQLTGGTAVNYWSHTAGNTYSTTLTDNYGVGTTTPFAKFAIHATDGETNTTLFAIASSTLSATTTLFSISNTGNLTLSALATPAGTFLAADANGVLIATTSPISSIFADYPLTGIGTSGSHLTLAFGTTTPNTWSGTNTFSTLPILGTLSGLVGANNGALYQVASSSLFGFTPISNVLTKGYFIVGNDAGVAQATSTIFITSTGKVGFGTTTPSANLVINGTTGQSFLQIASSTNQSIFEIDQNGTVSSNAIVPNGPYVTNLASYDLGASATRFNAVWAGAMNVGTSTFSMKSDTASNLGIYTAASGGGVQALTVNSAGGVGIGTGAASLSGVKFKIEAGALSVSDGYDDQTKIASISQATVAGSQVKLTVSWACGDTVAFTYNGGSVTYGTVTGADGKCWMDRNLGATQVAASSADTASYGHLFQWGRGADGHQITNSGTTGTLSSSDTPGNSNFILSPSAPYDWRSPQNDNLWQGVNGVNNVCPTGWRLPTSAEWGTLATAAGITNSATAYSSTLKLPVAGFRDRSDGSLYNQGSVGHYWSSTPSGSSAFDLHFDAGGVNPASANNRAYGFSVRCVKD